MAGKKIFADLAFRLSMESKKLRGDVKKANAEIRGLRQETKRTTDTFGKFLRIGAVALVARQVANFTLEMTRLSASAESVGRAFMAVSNTANLDALVEATAGTVSNLKLMQQTVQATNLGLEVDQLAKFFGFATKRAEETGQAVDTLVESIVGGIGRKSVLVLDNLGISASALREELKSVATWSEAVSNIIDRMGGSSAVGNPVDRLVASWENLKVIVADFVAGPGADIIEWLALFIQATTKLLKDPHAPEAIGRTADEVRDLITVIEDFQLGVGKEGSLFENFLAGTLTDFTQITFVASKLREIIALKKELAGLTGPPPELEKQPGAPIRPAGLFAPSDSGTDFEELIQGWEDARIAVLEYRGEIFNIVNMDVPEEHVDQWKSATEEIANDWSRMTESMIRDVIRLAQKSKISFSDIAGIVLSIAGLVASGGTTAGLGGLISLLIGKKAQGGIASGLTLVGEAGPELVNFSTPARVHSAPATQRLLSDTGGGDVVFHISGDSLVGILSNMQTKKEYFS